MLDALVSPGCRAERPGPVLCLLAFKTSSFWQGWKWWLFQLCTHFCIKSQRENSHFSSKHVFSIDQLFVHDISQEIQRVKGNEPALWEMVGEKKQGKTSHVTLKVTAERTVGDSPGLAAKKPPCEVGDAGSVPGRGTRSPRAAEQLSPCATTRVHALQENVPCAAKTRHI